MRPTKKQHVGVKTRSMRRHDNEEMGPQPKKSKLEKDSHHKDTKVQGRRRSKSVDVEGSCSSDSVLCLEELFENDSRDKNGLIPTVGEAEDRYEDTSDCSEDQGPATLETNFPFTAQDEIEDQLSWLECIYPDEGTVGLSAKGSFAATKNATQHAISSNDRKSVPVNFEKEWSVGSSLCCEEKIKKLLEKCKKLEKLLNEEKKKNEGLEADNDFLEQEIDRVYVEYGVKPKQETSF
uniref:Cwf21 domain-containing protein n=1 Tax=Steinernema glaseri TaxID=37863 RepID=A0A1I7Y7Y3_9BILA